MKNPIIKIILLTILITVVSCGSVKHLRQLASGETASGIGRPRNIIFLVHGIAGTEKNFGHMSEALTKHLNTAKETEEIPYQYIVQNFVYETHNNKNNTEQFAKDLGNAIDQYFLENGEITEHDKISIVAYSQGGIISLIWLYHAFLGEEVYHPEYAPHVNSYITLGTPFWGAKIAVFADMIKNLAEKIGDDVVPFFGERQLEDMSFGSPVIFNFRKAAIDPAFQELWKKISMQIHPVNFGGAATSMQLLTPFAAGKREYEDDTAVPLPSSHFDFIYASSLKTDYVSEETLPAREFKVTQFSKHHVVDALHVSALPSVPVWSSIADIPSACVKNSDCDHPTFKYVLASLKQLPLEPSEKRLSKMTAYLIDLNIRLPDGDTLPADKIKIELKSDDRDVKAASPMEFYSHGYSANIANESYRHFYFTGTSDRSFIPLEKRNAGSAFIDKTISVKVSAPGYKTRFIEALVRPTYSTFIEINLEKTKE